eukprot:TRINITY_DN1901_c0_g1_i12.p1 TRINITY_DN1901_c0_g1~~TRINITY_DN1901_c0_g1_i12.p1  ORF type:complete len:242 (+),score=35.34 TRINITY_DN1901_c0_g1_i12:73-798(+)
MCIRDRFIRQLEYSENTMTYNDMMTASEIIKNGITPIEFEYLLMNPKTKVINTLHNYILNEISALEKSANENVFTSCLLDCNPGDSLDIIAISVKILICKREYKKLIELYTLLNDHLKEQQQFYIAEQLAAKFYESLPFFEDSKSTSIDLLFSGDPIAVNKARLEFLGLLNGLPMVRCFFLMEMESYIEALKTILSCGTKEMKIEVVKSFIKSTKGLISEFQRHQMLRYIFASGITNKDFI